jgi:hypothetical protein
MKLIEWLKDLFAPKKTLAPPMPRQRKTAAKKPTTRKKTK